MIVLDAGPGTTRERASAKALDEALLPVRGRIVQDEEEHRIGYVALTRARRKTYLLLTPAGEEKSLWGHSLWRNEYREYDVSEEELLELLEPLRPERAMSYLCEPWHAGRDAGLQGAPLRLRPPCELYELPRTERQGTFLRAPRTCLRSVREGHHGS